MNRAFALVPIAFLGGLTPIRESTFLFLLGVSLVGAGLALFLPRSGEGEPARSARMMPFAAGPLGYLAGLVGSVERARGIADGFIDSSLEDLSELRTELATRNLETVRFLAHRIKGGARSAGFERVGDAAFELENAAREGDVPACRMQTETLTRSLDRLREVLAG